MYPAEHCQIGSSKNMDLGYLFFGQNINFCCCNEKLIETYTIFFLTKKVFLYLGLFITKNKYLKGDRFKETASIEG